MSEWQEVKSSNIAKVRYVDGGMELQFTNGAVYRYKDVPEEVFNELLKAESVGKFFFSHIKGKFEGDAVKCKHGRAMTDYCEPCGRVNGGE